MVDFSGLSDLGFLKPTQANASDDIGKADLLAQMLEDSSDLFDELGRARVIEGQMNKLQSQQTPSVLDRLLSPEGIASLLGTAAAGALGGPAGAAGFGLGRLQGMDAASEAEKAANRKAREELSEQHEKVLDRLDKSKQRFTTLLQSQPELFIDPATGQQTISPKMLGFYATGEPVSMNVLAKRALNRADAAWERTHTVLTDRLAEAQTDEDAEKILRGIFTNLKSPIPDDTIKTLARVRNTDIWNQETANMIVRHYPDVATDAFIFAGENRLPLHDPRVIRLLHGNYRDPDADSKMPDVSDEFLRIGKKIAAWQSDPANLDRIRELQTEATSENEFSMLLAAEVLTERNEFDLYRKQAGLFDPKDLSMMLNFHQDVTDKNKLADSITGYENLPARRAMSEEEKTRADFESAYRQTQAAKQVVRDDQAREDTALVEGYTLKLQAQLGLGNAAAAQFSQELAKKALDLSTRPDGKVDRARFQQELDRLVNELITEVKAAE